MNKTASGLTEAPFSYQKIKKPTSKEIGMAADEGFEPSLTEPESGVLPLH